MLKPKQQQKKSNEEMATRDPAVFNPNIAAYLGLLIFTHYYLITFYLKYLEL